MAKERLVTRRVIESKTYNVYKMEGITLTLLETIEEKGKISERDLAKKHNVDKIVLDCIKENKSVYGMTVSEFMQYATLIVDEDSEVEPPTDEEQANVEYEE